MENPGNKIGLLWLQWYKTRYSRFLTIFFSVHEENSIIPQLVMTHKDHKKISGSVPATRPVCEASGTMNQRLSDMLRDTQRNLRP